MKSIFKFDRDRTDLIHIKYLYFIYAGMSHSILAIFTYIVKTIFCKISNCGQIIETLIWNMTPMINAKWCILVNNAAKKLYKQQISD